MKPLIAILFLALPLTAEPPVKELIAGKDGDKKYFLIGDASEPPKKGFGLVIVMPGGDGSAEFLEFVKSLQAEALPKGYLVAQPVAPKWHKDQEVIWPTERHRKEIRGLKFTTEDFIESILTDTQKEHKIDANRIFTLSWSSSGPAAYAIAMSNPKISGSFIAMSVYKDEGLKPESAKGKPFFLYHSPEDKVCPYRFAETAKKSLEKHGAKVMLVDYDGGHGWQGATNDDIRTGIEWLERQTHKK